VAFDYRERRAVAQNRPKKQTVSTVVIAFALVIVAAYGLGVATGWLFFRLTPKQITVAKPANVQLPTTGVSGPVPNPLPLGGVSPVAPATPAAPLTFYETLPKGEKAVMGSGLNPKLTPQPPKQTPPPAVNATAPPSPAAPQPAPAVPAVKPEPAAQRTTALPIAASVEKKGSYAVQIASTKDKAEAEKLKERLVAKGAAAYVVTSEIKDKGIWYRVRIGHKLDEVKARELVTKSGKGAVIVPE